MSIEELIENYPDLIRMDGFDDCIIGVTSRFGQSEHFAYSVDKIIDKLMEDGMNGEDAYEFFQFNQVGAYVGETTPCFVEGL